MPVTAFRTGTALTLPSLSKVLALSLSKVLALSLSKVLALSLSKG